MSLASLPLRLATIGERCVPLSARLCDERGRTRGYQHKNFESRPIDGKTSAAEIMNEQKQPETQENRPEEQKKEKLN